MLALALSANRSPSELQSRLLRVLSPYLVGLHQDYGGVNFEMTRGSEIDFEHRIEFQFAKSENTNRQVNDWQPWPVKQILGDSHVTSWERMIAISVQENNEELIHLIFAKAIDAAANEFQQPVDRVRLVRIPSLSYSSERLLRAGELPQSQLEQRVLFECRAVRLDSSSQEVRLVPVLESTRTSKSVTEQDSLPPSSNTGAGGKQ